MTSLSAFSKYPLGLKSLKSRGMLLILLTLAYLSFKVESSARTFSWDPLFQYYADVNNNTVGDKYQLVMEMDLLFLNLTEWENSTNNHYVAMTVVLGDVN